METKNREEIEIDLGELLAVLLSKAAVIILCAIIFGGVAFGYAKFVMTPVYNSTTQIYVLSQQDSSTVTYNDLVTGTQLTKDYEVLIESRAVLEQVIEELNLDMDYSQLVGMITVGSQTDTRIISITVQDIDPYRAKVIADKVRDLSAEHIAAVMDIQSVKTVDEANLPEAPSGPNVIRYAMIGLLLGILLSAGIVVVRYLTNDKIRTPEDIEKYLGISTLGSIPIDNSMVENGKNQKNATKKTSSSNTNKKR